MFASHATIRRISSLALVAVVVCGTLAGCDIFASESPTAPQAAQQPNPQPPTPRKSGIKGTARVVPGVNADLRAVRVTAHKSEQELFDYIKSGIGRVSGSGLEVIWNMVVPSGVYFILVWLDQDNDGRLSYGDIVGVHGRFGLQTFDLKEVLVFDNEITDIGEIECDVLYGKPAWLSAEDWEK